MSGSQPVRARQASASWSTQHLDSLRLQEGAVALDLPYGEAPTGLEILARRRGWRYISGRQVLLWQGVAQLAAMTGAAPPVEAMAVALGITQ